MTGRNNNDFGLFKRSLNNKTYGYKVISDPTGSAPTDKIEAFEVRPGDCSSNKNWNDCNKDRERSELSEWYKKTAPGSEYWYGWSLYIPENYINVYPTKVALGQFHQKNSHVVWMFQNSNGGYHLDNQVGGHTAEYDILIPERDLRGRWHKIEVHVRWSTDRSGFMRVWVNDKQKVDYKGQTMDASRVYFKYGIYRSFLSRYKNAKNTNEVPAQKVYYSNVKRGKSRKEIEP